MPSYVTTAELAAHLGSGTSPSASQLAMMKRAISTASAQIDGLCGRTFEAQEEVRFFTPLTPALIEIGYANDISAIGIDNDSDYTYSTVLDATQYELIVTGNGRRRLALKSTATAVLPVTRNSVRVTAMFGELEAPDEIKEATMLQAARLWKRKDAVFGEIRSDNGFMRVLGSFDADAERILRDTGWLSRGASRMVFA